MRNNSICGCSRYLSFSTGYGPLKAPRDMGRTVVSDMRSLDSCPHMKYKPLGRTVTSCRRAGGRCLVYKGKTTSLVFSLDETLGPGGTLLPTPAFTRCRRTLTDINYRVDECCLGRRGSFYVRGSCPSILGERGPSVVFLYGPGGPAKVAVPRSLLRRVLRAYTVRKVFVMMSRYFLSFMGSPRGRALGKGLRGCPKLFVLGTFAGECTVPNIHLNCKFYSSERMLSQVRMIARP